MKQAFPHPLKWQLPWQINLLTVWRWWYMGTKLVVLRLSTRHYERAIKASIQLRIQIYRSWKVSKKKRIMLVSSNFTHSSTCWQLNNARKRNIRQYMACKWTIVLVQSCFFPYMLSNYKMKSLYGSKSSIQQQGVWLTYHFGHMYLKDVEAISEDLLQTCNWTGESASHKKERTTIKKREGKKLPPFKY